ncbi:hypothetical protein MTO96_008074 [Rhipicephalus appendiculatus]
MSRGCAAAHRYGLCCASRVSHAKAYASRDPALDGPTALPDSPPNCRITAYKTETTAHEPPSAVARTQRTTSRFSISRDFKIDDLHNEIKDLERRLKESERENKALKRVQARQERELLKAESARHHDGPEASRAHAEEIRALRALLAEGRDKLREYEKKLHLRNCELQKMRQVLADLQRQIDEKQTLVEKETEMQTKIDQLEREVQEKNTEVHGMDQEKKERLLARLRDIDLSGTFVKSTAKRPRAARRLSMDSQQSRLRLKSIAAGDPFLNESLSSESSPTERMPPLGPNVVKARRMSDTLVRSRRGDSLSSILEMQALQIHSNRSEDAMKNTNQGDDMESSLSKQITEVGKHEKFVFKDRQLAGRKSAAADAAAESLLPWQQWGSTC